MSPLPPPPLPPTPHTQKRAKADGMNTSQIGRAFLFYLTGTVVETHAYRRDFRRVSHQI